MLQEPVLIAEGNARLIAAAPDLLAACKAERPTPDENDLLRIVAEHLRTEADRQDRITSLPGPWADCLRAWAQRLELKADAIDAAIAKAEGK